MSNPFLDIPEEKPKVSGDKNPFLDLPKVSFSRKGQVQVADNSKNVASDSSADSKKSPAPEKGVLDDLGDTYLHHQAYMAQQFGKGITALPDFAWSIANAPLKYGARGLSALGVPIPDEVTWGLENPATPFESGRQIVGEAAGRALNEGAKALGPLGELGMSDDDREAVGYAPIGSEISPQGPGQEFLGRIAQEVGSNVLPALGILKKGQTLLNSGKVLPETQGGIGASLRNQAREAAENPGKFLASEAGYSAASGAGSAAAGAAADQVFDEDSGARPIAEIVGGVGTVAGLAGATSAVRKIDEALNISKNSVERAAAREIGASRHSSYDIDEATVPSLVENPTTAEILNDRELLARQRGIRRSDRPVGAQLNQRDADLAQRSVDEVQALKPQDVSGTEAVDATAARLKAEQDRALSLEEAATRQRLEQEANLAAQKEASVAKAQEAEGASVLSAKEQAQKRIRDAEEALRAAQKEASLIEDPELARAQQLETSAKGAETIRGAQKQAKATAGAQFAPEVVDPTGEFRVGTNQLRETVDSLSKITAPEDMPSFTRTETFKSLLSPDQTMNYEQFQNISSAWKKQVRGYTDPNQRRIGFEIIDAMESPFANAAENAGPDVEKLFKPLKVAGVERKKITDAISKGTIPKEADISDDVARALDASEQAKAQGLTLAEYIAKQKPTERVRDILEVMHGPKLESPMREDYLADYLKYYGEAASKSDAQRQAYANITADPGSVLARAKEVAGREGGRASGSSGKAGEGTRGSGSNAQGENIPAESARALKAARSLWFDTVVEPFKNKTIRQILGKDSAGESVIADNAALGRLLGAGGEQATTYAALRKAIGAEQASKLTREYILADLAARAGADGLVTPADLAVLRRKYRDVINYDRASGDNVARDLGNIERAARGAEKVRKLSAVEETEAVKKAREIRSQAEKHAAGQEREGKKAALTEETAQRRKIKGDLRDIEREAAKYALDTKEPTKAIERAMSAGPVAARELVDYARKVGGEGAVKGIARVTLDKIEKDIFTPGDPRLKQSALEKMLRDKRKELGYLLGSDGAVKRLEELAEAKAFIMRAEHEKAPVGSDTMENAAKRGLGKISADTARRLSGSIVGGVVGSAGGIPGAMAGALAGETMQRWLLSRRAAVDELIDDAVINPETYKLLTQKITPLNVKAIQSKFADQVNKAGLRQLIVEGER